MIKIIHSSILCKWGKPTQSAKNQLIIAPTVYQSFFNASYGTLHYRYFQTGNHNRNYVIM